MWPPTYGCFSPCPQCLKYCTNSCRTSGGLNRTRRKIIIMNILLINHYAGSPGHGMAFRPYYLAREWVQAGHSVKIAAASFSHLRSKNPDVRFGISEETIDGINYLWIKTPVYNGNGFGRVKNMLSFIIRLKNYMNSTSDQYDVVITSSTYPLDTYPVRIAQRKMKCKLVHEIHDLWPLSPMELGNIPYWHPYIMLMQKAENDAYRFCDKLVSILPCTAGHTAEHGLDPDKFFHIPNGICLEEWSQTTDSVPLEHRRAIMRFKEKEFFIVGYTGAHGISNSLDTIIDVAEKKINDVAFILVGQGPEKERLKQRVQLKGLENIVFLPAVPKTSIPGILNLFDACFIAWNRNPLYRFGISPNKIMDYMASSKPIIHAVEAANDPVRDSGCGISVPPEDPQAVVDAIRKLQAMSPVERELMGQRGREYVVKNHDYKVIAQRFLDILEK